MSSSGSDERQQSDWQCCCARWAGHKCCIDLSLSGVIGTILLVVELQALQVVVVAGDGASRLLSEFEQLNAAEGY